MLLVIDSKESGKYFRIGNSFLGVGIFKLSKRHKNKARMRGVIGFVLLVCVLAQVYFVALMKGLCYCEG